MQTNTLNIALRKFARLYNHFYCMAFLSFTNLGIFNFVSWKRTALI